jgi:hypothetical protein
VERQARSHDRRATLPQKQPVERLVERDDQHQQPRRERQSSPSERGRQRQRCRRGCPVPPAQIQSSRARATTQEQHHPGNASSGEVGVDHPGQRPPLQMLPLQDRVEDDAAASVDEPHAQIDVLDRRAREALLIEAADRDEFIPTDCAQSRPEGGRRASRHLVDVVVEEVPEVRNDAACARIVVVRPEERCQRGIGRKRSLDPRERVGMHRDIGVDEHDHVPARAFGPGVPRRCRPRAAWSVDDDELLRRVDGGFDRLDALGESRGRIRCRYDDGERSHAANCRTNDALQPLRAVPMTMSPESSSRGVDPLTLEAISRVESHLVQEGFRGYDPFDTLMSPLFRLPLLRSSRGVRFAAQQIGRRLPLNLRPLLRVPKGYNPVTLGLVIEACSYLAHVEPERVSVLRARARDCIEELERLRSPGYSGACWGYDFYWEARFARLPHYHPTIVATGIISNALFAASNLLGISEGLALCESAARFVLNDVSRTEYADGTFCWGYSPGDRQQVLNATMKGARLCAQVYSVTGDDACREAAQRTSQFVAAQHRGDGSWPYAVADARSWSDNFHTAYVLDAFDEYERHTGDKQFVDAKRSGWRYYRANFFADDSVPTHYPRTRYPIDATSCAQSMLTLCRFGDIETAQRVADWTIKNMQCSDGHFAYQLRRGYRIRTPYMRWASAYMFAGLSALAYALAKEGTTK